MRGYEGVFREIERWAARLGIRLIREIDDGLLRAWRESWTVAPSTQRTKLQRLKAFFRFAVKSGWLQESPAAHIQAPKVDSPPTMPLSRSEVRALVRASDGQDRERALLLLLRYSGLAIRDAATLAREALDGDQLTLRRAKSGELVLCALPPLVVDALDGIAIPGKRHFFWTGTSRPETVTKYWRARLQKIAKQANVEEFKPHRLRDTFAVELLLRGVSMQDVSALLGHSSIQTTERYYAPWNRARRDRLAGVLKDTFSADRLLRPVAPGMAATASGRDSLLDQVETVRRELDALGRELDALVRTYKGRAA